MKKSKKVLLNRAQAAEYLGINVTTFDKYIRFNNDLKRFMIGSQERFLKNELIRWIEKHSI
ncbi:helix-turn-helix domain-containing protein [Pediococcus acidilactici]